VMPMPEITISRIPDGQRFTLLLETTGRELKGTVEAVRLMGILRIEMGLPPMQKPTK